MNGYKANERDSFEFMEFSESVVNDLVLQLQSLSHEKKKKILLTSLTIRTCCTALLQRILN